MAENLAGSVFMWLTAEEKTGEKYMNSPIYRCRCLCGREAEVPASALRSGQGGCCGNCVRTLQALCGPEPEVEGMKLACLTLGRPTGKKVRNSPLYTATCSCGAECTVTLSALRCAKAIACPSCQVDLAAKGYGVRK